MLPVAPYKWKWNLDWNMAMWINHTAYLMCVYLQFMAALSLLTIGGIRVMWLSSQRMRHSSALLCACSCCWGLGESGRLSLISSWQFRAHLLSRSCIHMYRETYGQHDWWHSTNNMNSLTCSWFTSFPVFSCSSTTGFMQFSRQRCKLSCDPAWSLQHSDEHWKALTCRGRIQSRSNLSNSLSNSLPIFSPAILITCSKAVSRLHWDVGVSAGILYCEYI